MRCWCWRRREITEIRPSDELRREALDIGTLLELVRPSVVAVNTGEQTGDGMFASAGLGVVLSDEGLVLTNAHVVSGAQSISASTCSTGAPARPSWSGVSPSAMLR